jgi:glycerol kinase/glycerophosphoryl diester phosphodiesterase
MPDDNRPFLVVGHRGAAARAPENTAASLRAGLDAGADAIEIDVGISTDGRVVLLHDLTLDRTTNGRGDLDTWSWSSLSDLDAGSWYSPRFAAEPLLDLDGALALVRPHASIIVEIKAHDERAGRVLPVDLKTAEEVVAALHRTGGPEGATVSSARWDLLPFVSRAAPGVATALTVHYRQPADPFAAAERIGATALHPNRRLCTHEFVRRAREAGLLVIPYVVNRAKELAPLLEVGVDGVFSDDPGAIRRILAHRAPASTPSAPLTLGIDQGSGGTRAVLLSGDDRVLASKAVPVGSRKDSAGALVQDPEAIAESVLRATAPLLDEAPGPVESAGIATQRSSLVVWRRSDGRAVAPVTSWRATGDMDAATPFSEREEAIARTTGLTARYPYGAIRLAHLLRAGGPVAAGLRRGTLVAGPVGAFLAARLAGRRDGEVDPSLAQRMLLLDLHTRRYDPALLALAGISTSAVPSVVPSTHARGRLRLGAHRPRLLAVLGDANAAFRAVAGPSGHGAVLVLGTGGFLLVGTGRRPVEVPGLLTTLLWEDAEGPFYAVEGTVHGLLANLLEVRRRAGLEKLSPDLVAARAGPARRAPVVFPAIEGTGTPDWRIAPAFDVEEGEWTADELIRGTVAGIAEQFGRIGDRLREHGLLPQEIRATCGLAPSPHLRGAIAERLGRPVLYDPRPHRTAAGAALLARSVRDEA